MKIMILAAGSGTRLMPLTKNTPKSLLLLQNGRTILETQLERIEKSGVIDEVVISIGYRGEQIEAKLEGYDGKIKVKTVFNPFYDVSNNLHSLWLTKSEMDDDFIITNGDNLFDADVYEDLVKKTGPGIYLTINTKKDFDDDDMKVTIQRGKVRAVSKKLERSKTHAESVGLVKVSGEKYREAFKKTMEKLARNKNYLNCFWLEIFNELNKNCIDVEPFEIDGSKWREIDVHPDFERVVKQLGLGLKNEAENEK